MLPDRVSNPGPLTYESGALPIALRGPATVKVKVFHIQIAVGEMGVRAPLYLGPTDEKRSPTLSFGCLILPLFEKGTLVLLGC